MTRGMEKYARMDRFELEAHANAYELKYQDLRDNMEERFAEFREEEVTKAVAHERQVIDYILKYASIQHAELMTIAELYHSHGHARTIGESIIIEKFVKYVIEGKIDWGSYENFGQKEREEMDRLQRHFEWLDGGK